METDKNPWSCVNYDTLDVLSQHPTQEHANDSKWSYEHEINPPLLNVVITNDLKWNDQI